MIKSNQISFLGYNISISKGLNNYLHSYQFGFQNFIRILIIKWIANIVTNYRWSSIMLWTININTPDCIWHKKIGFDWRSKIIRSHSTWSKLRDKFVRFYFWNRYSRSLYERLEMEIKSFMLNIQFRSLLNLSAFTSSMFYNNKVKDD